MSAFIEGLSAIFLIAGAFFCLVGGIGLLRMPDFYTRVHAGSVTDPLGATLILIGLMLQAGLTLVCVKLAMMGVLLLLASPSASHALTRAALMSGLKPMHDTRSSAEEVPSSKP